MRKLIMFLKKKRMLQKIIFRMFSISLRKKIKSCNNKLMAKINILQNSRRITIHCKNKVKDKMICNLKSSQKKEKN